VRNVDKLAKSFKQAIPETIQELSKKFEQAEKIEEDDNDAKDGRKTSQRKKTFWKIGKKKDPQSPKDKVQTQINLRKPTEYEPVAFTDEASQKIVEIWKCFKDRVLDNEYLKEV